MAAVRIDKWLWCVRRYKTRSQATDACRAGKIKLNGVPVKPARELEVGDVIEFFKDHIHYKIRVKEILFNRVGAKLVDQYMEDLTPQEEIEKLKVIKSNFEYRQRGAGRPTKRERRDIDHLKDLY